MPRLDGKIQIESKEDMKRRQLPSPNRADALCLTFAYPVIKRDRNLDSVVSGEASDYDPYSNY